MIDAKYLRSDSELLMESERRRFKDENLIVNALKMDEWWRNSNSEMMKLSTELNKKQKVLNKTINVMKKQLSNKFEEKNEKKLEENELKELIKLEIEKRDDLNEETQQIKKLQLEIEEKKKQTDELNVERMNLLFQISNLIHAKVPVSKDIKERELLKEYEGKMQKNQSHLSHEILNQKIVNSASSFQMNKCILSFSEKYYSEKKYEKSNSNSNFQFCCPSMFQFKDVIFSPSILPQYYYSIIEKNEEKKGI